MRKTYFTYIMTNKTDKVLYTGMTNNLMRRVFEHKEGVVEGFTKKYNLKKLVYYEVCYDVQIAIQREKQIKNFSRKKKIELIESLNPSWKDLWDEVLEW